MSIKTAAMKPIKRIEILESLTDTQCLLATPWVTGLDLKNKDWDRGIIILRLGPPRVGKTYTTEAVSERARVPLYNISAARLGRFPGDVEVALNQALDLWKLRKAMLLLVDVDVFLNARSNIDLTQNELLEYYHGICFMLTNRMASLDHAIQSCVDLFLHYADLTVTARRRIWQNFFIKTGRSRFAISEAELDGLAEFKLKGLEIKNVVKTAHLLSVKDTTKKIGNDELMMLVKNRLQALATLGEQ
ncbi:hypothetical protein QQZ08_003676 [Neonectria magnoliae]|uniref:ATPase AAA-type core domain-containing protein n=1 Tax=Neonectria magnoliae TaxID=2732573 RepID=A0ABR1I939_9HYPO